MRDEPYVLDYPRRAAVLECIKEVCRFRRWELLAAHVRTNHVHVVLDANAPPERVMTTLKAYASRKLNRIDNGPCRRWARHGSTRHLSTTEQVSDALSYVVSGQGEPMAVFDAACE